MWLSMAKEIQRQCDPEEDQDETTQKEVREEIKYNIRMLCLRRKLLANQSIVQVSIS